MPTYSYKCTQCGHAFDIQQSFADASLTVCPECGGPLRKVFGNLGVTFNGSGFYRTDSRAGGASGSSGAASRDSSSGDSKSGSSASGGAASSGGFAPSTSASGSGSGGSSASSD